MLIKIIRHPVVIYGAVLALLAFALESLKYYYRIRQISTELYIVVLAVAFTFLGVWIGKKVSASKTRNKFAINRKAIKVLKISRRELEVLNELSKGLSNDEIADKLHISLSTVKTHVSSLLIKLEVDNRVKAIKKAQTLQIIPN